MVDISTIELSFKRIPECDSNLAKTIASKTKTNYLIGSSIAVGAGLLLLIWSPEGVSKFVGGSFAVGGAGASVYTLKRKVDDSSEAQEERIKFGIAESIRKAKLAVENERNSLTNEAHQMHSFCFDTTNAINDTVQFNCYTVKVSHREGCVSVGFRNDKVLYRSETRTELYRTSKGKLKTRQRKVQVPDRVKFTIAFPTRQRAVKGVMPIERYNQMIALYNARVQKAQKLADFNRRYATAEENVRQQGDQIYFSPEEKRAIEHAKELERFDLLLNQIEEVVPVEVDENEFAEFDQLLGLDQLPEPLEVEISQEEEEADESDEEVQFSESELREIGLPTIRQQFGITARSYAEAFTKLREKGITIHS